MQDKATSFRDYETGEPSTVTDKIADTAALVKDKVSDMKDKVSDLSQSAANKIDDNRAAAASGLDKAATGLHENAASLPGGEKVSSLAHATADKLSSTATYVREHDVNRMMADVETVVKNNPGPALLAAAAVGFLVGRAFSSND